MKCDKKKQQCPVEGFRDVCGIVRCGECRAKQDAIKWKKCMVCKEVCCTFCTNAGTEKCSDLANRPKQFAMCPECAEMACGGMGGDY
jgi:hypothetical protein